MWAALLMGSLRFCTVVRGPKDGVAVAGMASLEQL